MEIKEKYGVPIEGDLLITAVGTLGNVWKVDNRRFYYKDGNLIRISDLQGESITSPLIFLIVREKETFR